MSEEQVTGSIEEESSAADDNGATVLANFLQEHYGSLIKVESEQHDKIQTPYIVAYHHFALFHTQLRKWTNLLESVARKYPQVKFAIGELSTYKNSTKYSLAEYDLSKSPLLYSVNHHRNKAKIRNTYDLKGLSECCNELLDDDELESKPIPKPSRTCVKKVVALNFTEMVETNPKDVFIFFYKPYCDACKPLFARVEKLASMLHSNGDSKHIAVVRMNIYANCIPDKRFSRNLTPQFYLKRSGENHYISFWSHWGQWTVEDMLKFLAKHTTKEIRRYNRNGEERHRKEKRKGKDK